MNNILSTSPHQILGSNTGGYAPHHNGGRPLNKITWDSFSQIAKLSGDVDHEPSTPKSGRGGLRNSSDDDIE